MIHSRDAQANLPGEKAATDSLDQLASMMFSQAKEADIEHAF